MRKFICSLAASAVMGTGLVLAAPVAAHADTPNCVGRAEFRQVHRGMTKRKVHRIFDVRGKRTSVSTYGRDRDEYRSYRVCRGWGNPRWSSVDLNFDNYMSNRSGMRLYSKSSYITR